MAKFTLRPGEAWYASPYSFYDRYSPACERDKRENNGRVLAMMVGPCATVDGAVRALVDDDTQDYAVCFVFKGPKSGNREKVSRTSFVIEIGNEKA